MKRFMLFSKGVLVEGKRVRCCTSHQKRGFDGRSLLSLLPLIPVFQPSCLAYVLALGDGDRFRCPLYIVGTPLTRKTSRVPPPVELRSLLVCFEVMEHMSS